MSEDLQGFILADNYWSSQDPINVTYQRRYRCYGKIDGWCYYNVRVISQGVIRTFYRVRTFLERPASKQKTGQRIVEYAKNSGDCPNERQQAPSYRVKPARINLMYSEIEREQKLLIHV